MVNIKRFLKTAGVYLLGSVLSKLVSFFLLPIYTSYLEPTQYGTYDLVFSFINLIAPIAFLQIWDSTFRFSFDSKDNQSKYRLINNSLVVCFFGIILYFVIWLIVDQFYHFEYFYYILLYGLLFAFHYVYTFAARSFLNNSLYVFSGLLNTIITAILNVVLITVYNWNINAMYVSACVGITIQILIIEWKLKLFKHFTFKDIDLKAIKDMITFSVPLCVATISYWLLSGYSKIIISYFCGNHENGLYAVANKFASLITMVVAVFQFAWNEAAYLMANDNIRTVIYGKIINVMLKLMIWGTTFSIIIIKIIFPYFIDSQYQDALSIIPATIIGVATNTLAGFLGTLFSTEKKTTFVMISTFVAATCNVICGLIGSIFFGLQGIIIALMISFIVLLIMRMWKLTREGLFKVNFGFLKSVPILYIATIIFYINSSLWFLWFFLLILLLLFWFAIRKDLSIFASRRKNNGK